MRHNLSFIQRKMMIEDQVKFRIYRIIFCEQHKIVRSSLEFDVYVENVYEKLLQKLITLHFADWVLVCVMVLLNWGFMSLKKEIFSTCHDLECKSETEVHYFTFGGNAILLVLLSIIIHMDCLGFAILAAMLFLVWQSARYERAILVNRGIYDVYDLAVFLKVFSGLD